MTKRLLLAGVLLLTVILFANCGDEDPVQSTNSAPGQITIDGTAGTPAHGAVGVSLTPTIGWACSDPDGDDLTYTVSFGTSSPPPVVATDQSTHSYTPAALAYSTMYYWSVTAEDPSGATRSSDVWNFTTLDPPVETVTAPNAPAGPTAGDVDSSLTFTISGASSSDGHPLEYRFDWGDGSMSLWSSSTNGSHNWPTPGTYHVSLQARCQTHPAVISDWSDSTAVTITSSVPETVSTPDAPSGPATGLENEDLEYSGSGAVSSYGDDLEYRFDWGDGSFSNWTTTSLQHSWPTAGTYDIKAQARCVSHPDIESGWSAATSVTISEYTPETVSTPEAPNGTTSGEEGESLNFATTGAVSSEGHAVAYRFDWGNGTISTWGSLATRSYTWSTAGTYEVKVQARCISHPTVMSGWSPGLTVTITPAAAETVSAPGAPTAPATGETGESLIVTNTGGSVSSDGHSIQYRIDFGDGDTTLWYTSLTTIQHSWSAAGTYEIKAQARCLSHPDIESPWSDAAAITISDPAEVIPSPPDTIYGTFEGAINEAYEYLVLHSTQTNLGHAIEGRFDWGDGTYSDWIAAAPYSASHMWTDTGTYVVKYQARCATHTDITAESDSLLVTIDSVAAETVSKPPYFSMQSHQRYPETNQEITYNVYGGASSLGHEVEVMFDWGDGTQSGWVPHLGTVTKTWTTAGSFAMTRQARCVDHPEIVSEWSDAIYIYPRDPETVSAPDVPSGPDTGTVNEYLLYTTTGAASSWGHSNIYIEYRWDWGDGSAITSWDTDTSMSHMYTAIGDYEIKTQARCVLPTHDPIESAWSLPKVLTVQESIALNGSLHGPNAGPVNVSITFETYYAATTSEGHTVEYRFDFGDGTISDWSLSMSASHAFTAAGTYNVIYQARCADHPTIMTDWSYHHSIDITDAPETLTTPGTFTNYENTFEVGEEFSVACRGSESNWGDSLEYQVDFGDGTLSDWTGATWGGDFKWMATFPYTYTSPGTYDVVCRSRCVAHPSIVSDWSVVRTLYAVEALASMPAPTGPMTGTVGENLTYTTVGTTSSEGHALEYSFQYWGYSSMISQSDWSTSLSDDHVFTSTGSVYRVRVAARCATHTNAIIYSPFTSYITITE